MLITPVLVLLLVLLFYKRPVNDVVGWTPPPPTLWQGPQGLAGPRQGAGYDAGQGAAEHAAGWATAQGQTVQQAPSTNPKVPMDLNDLFGGPKRR